MTILETTLCLMCCPRDLVSRPDETVLSLAAKSAPVFIEFLTHAGTSCSRKSKDCHNDVIIINTTSYFIDVHMPPRVGKETPEYPRFSFTLKNPYCCLKFDKLRATI